jgi:hypothetical protein
MSERLKGPALTTYQCPVTGKVFDGDEILMPTRITRDADAWSNQKPVHMGQKFCPEVQEKIDDGYICLVVADESKSGIKNDTQMIQKDDVGNVHRTGEILYVKQHVAEQLFTGIDTDKFKMMFIGIEASEILKAKIAEATEEK